MLEVKQELAHIDDSAQVRWKNSNPQRSSRSAQTHQGKKAGIGKQTERKKGNLSPQKPRGLLKQSEGDMLELPNP